MPFGRGRGFRWMYYATGMPCWMRAGLKYPPCISILSEKERENIIKQIRKSIENIENSENSENKKE